MNRPLYDDWLGLYRSWSQAATRTLSGQLGMWNVPHRIVSGVLDGLLHAVAAAPGGHGQQAGTPPGEPDDLERLAAERVRRGYAPPPEIYAVPHRDRIDWSRFPDWARPVDPEVFEGAGHEG